MKRVSASGSDAANLSESKFETGIYMYVGGNINSSQYPVRNPPSWWNFVVNVKSLNRFAV